MAIRTIEQARAWRGKLSTVTDALTDANASIAAELFPTLTNSGTLIPVGSRIRWGDALCVAQYDTYDRVDTDPDHDTNGWARLAFHNGYRDIPDTMTTATMFSQNEIGWRGDKFWRSLIDNNSWTPENYPSGWEEVNI